MIFAKYRKNKLEKIVDNIYNDKNSIYYFCKRNYNNSLPAEEHKKRINEYNYNEEYKMHNKFNLTLIPYGFENCRFSNNNEVWNKIKSYVSNNKKRCEICNSKKNLVCHEPWFYDINNKLIKLNSLQFICENCHDVVHFDNLIIQFDKQMVTFNKNNDINVFKKAKKIAKNLKKNYYIKYYIKYFLNKKCDVKTAESNILYTKLPIIKKVYEDINQFKFDIDSISNKTNLEWKKCEEIIKQWNFKKQ